jgi:carbamoyl-phosphate synthase large subunit
VGVLHACSAMGGRGPLTIQAFLTQRGPVLSEVNARFGGGFPLAFEAGADYPAWLMDMVAGKSVEPLLGAYEPGVYMTRYNVEHFVRRPHW